MEVNVSRLAPAEPARHVDTELVYDNEPSSQSFELAVN